MTGVWFARIDFDAPLREAQSVIRRFLEARPDDRWALVRYELPQSERHLAAAVHAVIRSHADGTQVSTSMDGELLRRLSGSHHVRHAFEVAGVPDGAEAAWLVHIGDLTDGDGGAMLVAQLDATIDEDAVPLPNPAGRVLLGLPEQGPGDDVLSLGIMALADVR